MDFGLSHSETKGAKVTGGTRLTFALFLSLELRGLARSRARRRQSFRRRPARRDRNCSPWGRRGAERGKDNRPRPATGRLDRKSTRLNSSHLGISDAVFCLKK